MAYFPLKFLSLTLKSGDFMTRGLSLSLSGILTLENTLRISVLAKKNHSNFTSVKGFYVPDHELRESLVLVEIDLSKQKICF